MGEKTSATQAKIILVSMVLGLVMGLLAYTNSWVGLVGVLKPIGGVFISLLKMMIIPLVLSSIFMAVANLGDPKELGRLGGRSIAYYTLTTVFAAFIGLVMVNLIEPGVGLNIGELEVEKLSGVIEKRVNMGAEAGLWKTVIGVFLGAVPTNPIKALAENNILQVIVFSILLGIVSLYYRKKAEPIISFMESLEFLSMRLVDWIMYLAPIGIFCLTASVIADTGFDAISALSKFVFTVLAGLFIHFAFLLTLGSWRLKKSPIFILKKCLPVLTTAFSTSSSAATLPITMNTVEDELGVEKKTAQFILPLGATINMDGTAIYESAAVIFIGQAYGLNLGLTNQIVIFFTASLAAIGAAAIPGAGLVTMSIVLTAVGFPLEGIGLILAADRILDMFRTATNVFGDCVGAITVDSMMQKK